MIYCSKVKKGEIWEKSIPRTLSTESRVRSLKKEEKLINHPKAGKAEKLVTNTISLSESRIFTILFFIQLQCQHFTFPLTLSEIKTFPILSVLM